MARRATDPKISVAVIQPLFAALADRGADAAAFCQDLGLDPRIVGDPEAKVSLHRLDAIWSRAAELILERPLRTSEPHLATILEGLVSRLLAELPGSPSMAQRVRDELLRAGLHGDLSLRPIARRLGLSPRTLQRRLRDEATSLSDLVDEARCAAATRLLSGAETGIAEIAQAIGFSEPTAFHRAFKRWTGRTPAQFRRPSRRL